MFQNPLMQNSIRRKRVIHKGPIVTLKGILIILGLFVLPSCMSLKSIIGQKNEADGTNSKSGTSFTPQNKSVGLKSVLHKVWVRPTEKGDDYGYRKNVRMEPLLLSDKVIQGNGFDSLVAVDRKLGHVIWRIEVQGGVEGGAAVVGDYLFFGGNDGQFYSVSAETGAVLWKVPVRVETLSAPAVADGKVYFITGNNVLHALDASDGRELWIYSRSDVQTFSIRGASAPTVKDGNVYVGFGDGYLVGLDARTGAIHWETALNKNKNFRDLDSRPTLDGSTIYVTGFDSSIYSLNAKTGELLWKSQPGGFGDVLIVNEKLFYAGSNGEVVALNKKDGSLIWKVNLKGGIPSSPKIYNDHVVVGLSNGPLAVLDQGTGQVLSTLDPGHGIHTPIAVDEVKKEMYFLSNSAWLYKIGEEEILN